MRVSEGRVGDDYSTGYSDKTAYIKFSKGGKVADFKPFLKSFSINRKYNSKYGQKAESFYDEVNWQFDTEQPVFTLAFEVPSNSINEAIVNHSKFQYLMRMVYPPHSDTNEMMVQQIELHFSNLISDNGVLGGGGFGSYHQAILDQKQIEKQNNVDTDGRIYKMKKSDIAKLFNREGKGVVIPEDRAFQSAKSTEKTTLLGQRTEIDTYTASDPLTMQQSGFGNPNKKAVAHAGETLEDELNFLKQLSDPAGNTPFGPHKVNREGESLLVFIKKLTYKPDLTMGFYEFSGMIFPKVFSVNLNIEVGNDDMGLLK